MTGKEEPPLLILVGPTASGKTDLALQLAAQSPSDIINADSVQVYKYFDIGSGKPTQAERQSVPHHLIDTFDPLDSVDAARWATLADAAISEIRGRGRTPIVCGGTFLWIRALVHGLAPAPPADETVRERHRLRAEAEGRAALHADLVRVDEPSAARLNPNDLVRVSRALEVHELTGKPMSQWQAEHGFRERRHNARFVGILHPGPELDARMRTRIEGMWHAGWLDEVRDLLKSGYEGARAMGAVGYRQVRSAVEAEGHPDMAALTDEIVRATRVFARRQRTWLRDENVRWCSPEELPGITLDTLLASP